MTKNKECSLGIWRGGVIIITPPQRCSARSSGNKYKVCWLGLRTFRISFIKRYSANSLVNKAREPYKGLDRGRESYLEIASQELCD